MKPPVPNLPTQRDPNRRFLPGFTPNPSGPPKGAGAVREMARQYLPAAMAKVGELIGSPDPKVALAASREILDRVFGKPVQAVESEVRTFDIAQLYLAAVKAVNGDRAAMLDVTGDGGAEYEAAAIEHDSGAEW
jgi:hypothetical protein